MIRVTYQTLLRGIRLIWPCGGQSVTADRGRLGALRFLANLGGVSVKRYLVWAVVCLLLPVSDAVAQTTAEASSSPAFNGLPSHHASP